MTNSIFAFTEGGVHPPAFISVYRSTTGMLTVTVRSTASESRYAHLGTIELDPKVMRDMAKAILKELGE